MLMSLTNQSSETIFDPGGLDLRSTDYHLKGKLAGDL
jgi:hypothetical protein